MTNDLSVSDTPTSPKSSAQIRDKNPLFIVIGSAIVLLMFFTGLIFLLSLNEITTATIRDISLILLAVLNILIGFVILVLIIILVYLVMKINDLIQLVNTELKPLLDKVNDTATRTRDTAKVVQDRVVFISDEAIKPVINIVSLISAVKAVLKTLFKRD